jgi:hypothetical protein
MSRFRAGVTPIGYSRELETQLWTARGHQLEDLRRLWKWRDAIEANRLERILCTRFILDAADLLAGGFEWDEVMGAFFEGWRDDEIRKVKGA